MIVSAVDRTVLGGNTFDQLFGRDKSLVVMPGAESKSTVIRGNLDQKLVIEYIAKRNSPLYR